MKAKILFALLCILLILQSCKVQSLTVKPIPQKATHWCWAACMEMIMKFNNEKENRYIYKSQCDLAIDWYEMQRILQGNTTAEVFKPNLCCIGDCDIKPRCNNLILFDSIAKYFSKPAISYTLPKSTIMTPLDIENQISNSKQPFISGIQISKPNDHVVVITGYRYEGSKLWLVGINPISNTLCVYLESQWPYNDSEDADLGEKISGYVWNLQPLIPTPNPIIPTIIPINSLSSVSNNVIIRRKGVNSMNSEVNKDSSISIANPENVPISKQIVNINFGNKPKPFQGEKLHELSNDEFAALATNKNYSLVPVKYLSLEALINISSDKLNLPNVELKNRQVIDVIYKKSNPYTINRFQFIKDRWKPISVFKQPDDIKNFLKNDTINWEKKILRKYWTEPTIQQNNGFEKVLFPPYIYEFYRYKNGDNYLYIPSSDYKILSTNKEGNFKKGEPYSEKSILEILKNVAIDDINKK
jgi:Papain-like cysteine protease AvrRpt2